MILKGSQRGNGGQLAKHLMNTLDNDHITVHSLRGFVAQDLRGCFDEAHAISKATKCKQFLFSLSFNPPQHENVSVDNFLTAITRAEENLGLSGQPRAIIFHEKEGRRHAHAVWSRIDATELKAINLPHFKIKLSNLSKELYLEHGWNLPRGYRENKWKNPLNFSLSEFQQAKRLDMDPREIKQLFHQAFTQSDSAQAFKAALEDSGYYLAKGDRRGMVAVDLHSKIYSVARWAGVKTKELRAKFGEPDHLPSVDATKTEIRKHLSKNVRAYMHEMRAQQRKEIEPFYAERQALITQQRIERAKLKRIQTRRGREEHRARSMRFARGIKGAWELLTGKRHAIRKENEADLARRKNRDVMEREVLFKKQLTNRQHLQARIENLRTDQRNERKRLMKKVAQILKRNKEAQREITRSRKDPQYSLSR